MSYVGKSWKNRKNGGKSMRNQATRWVAEYIAKNHISIEEIEKKCHISREKLTIGTEQTLSGEELLELCVYLRIRPEEIPMDWK